MGISTQRVLQVVEREQQIVPIVQQILYYGNMYPESPTGRRESTTDSTDSTTGSLLREHVPGESYR